MKTCKTLSLILICAALVACGTAPADEITPPSSVETSGQSGDAADNEITKSASDIEKTESETEPETESDPDVIADLNGDWIESGWQDAGTYMICTISDETIEIAWCMDAGETIALYWAGTAPAPTEPGNYTWDSANDKEQTDYAMFASSDDYKTFEYHADTDEITYSQSAMGVTRTVHMIRYIE